MPAFRIHVTTALGEDKRIVFRNAHYTSPDQAEADFKYQQGRKNSQGIPYMPAGEITKIELVTGKVENPHISLV